MDKTNLKSTFLWDIAEKIISYDTVSFKSNSACSNMIANLLEDIGFTVKIEQFDDNGHMKEQVIAWAGPPVEDGIILSGHIDTVPFENQPGWTKNALELTLEEDKIFGRGSCDMKLFIVHCIQALKELDLNKLKKPIVCIFTADEEVGCLGAKRLLTKLETILDNMPIPKRALIGEPTNFNIINTHKGIVHFDINIAGKGGHSSRPDLGVNAISPLGEIISLIEATNFEYQQKLDPVLKKLFPDFPYNYLHMAQVDGGIAVNMIPEQCRLTISYRCFPTDPPYKLLNDLKFEIQKLNCSSQISFGNEFSTPGLATSLDPTLEKALKDLTGNSSTESVSFATDAGYLSSLGIQCYVCGPGEIKMAHQPDEYMPLEHFLKGPLFLKKLLLDLVF